MFPQFCLLKKVFVIYYCLYFFRNYKALGLALRFILDALKKSPNSKMYNFGITALDRFKHRLKDYHQYCSHISTIPHFQQFPQHLIEVCSFIKH